MKILVDDISSIIKSNDGRKHYMTLSRYSDLASQMLQTFMSVDARLVVKSTKSSKHVLEASDVEMGERIVEITIPLPYISNTIKANQDKLTRN